MDDGVPSQASYYVPAHLERAGPFNPDGNNGFNIEHLRNFNNTAPRAPSVSKRSRVTAPRTHAANTPSVATTSAASTSTLLAARRMAAPASTVRRSVASGTRCSVKVATGGSSPVPTGTTAACSVLTIAVRARIFTRGVPARLCDGPQWQRRRSYGPRRSSMACAAATASPKRPADRSPGVRSLRSTPSNRPCATQWKRRGRRAGAATRTPMSTRPKLRDDGREARGAPRLRHRCVDRPARSVGHELFAVYLHNPSLTQVGISSR